MKGIRKKRYTINIQIYDKLLDCRPYYNNYNIFDNDNEIFDRDIPLFKLNQNLSMFKKIHYYPSSNESKVINDFFSLLFHYSLEKTVSYKLSLCF